MPSSARCRRLPTAHPAQHTPRSVGTHNARKPPPTSDSPAPLNKRAGLDRRGTHRFRHALATEMLRAGASLPEVGQVLRHRSQLSTSIYAKVDQNALRPLARRWPGAGQ